MGPDSPLERRFEILHWKVERIPSKLALRAWTAIGRGITILRLVHWVPQTSNAEGYLHFESQEDLQLKVEEVLTASPRLRSLQIRTTPSKLELSILESKHQLRWLQINSVISKPMDFSSLTKLELLAGSDSTLQLITGLLKLNRLKWVHVTGLKKSWLYQLPASVEAIYSTGKLPSGVSFDHLPNLTRLGLNSVRELDFETVPKAASLVTLDLTTIRRMHNHATLAGAFPNLKRLNVGRIREEDYEELKAILRNVEINLWDGFLSSSS